MIADTDHLWGIGGHADWVWRTFTRGHNILYMDPYAYLHLVPGYPDGDEGPRKAMGRCAAVSRSIDLAEMVPRTDLTSTGFALVAEGREYLIYHPYGDPVFVDLVGMEGRSRSSGFIPSRIGANGVLNFPATVLSRCFHLTTGNGLYTSRARPSGY